MAIYDTALICEKGHLINSSSIRYPENNSHFCKECGTKTINRCLSCDYVIKGDYHEHGINVFRTFDIPSYCGNCGNAYPWIEEKTKALNELLELSDITKEEKEDFNRNLSDIISETPRTNVAALKLKAIGTKVGSEIWEVAKGIIIEIASETAKKTMGL